MEARGSRGGEVRMLVDVYIKAPLDNVQLKNNISSSEGVFNSVIDLSAARRS